jgi:hypothetical protein
MCNAKGDGQTVMMDASEPLMRRKRASEINTYMLHNESPVLSARPCGAANKQNRDKAPQRYPFKVRKRETEKGKKKYRAPDENQVGYQTARVAYANWLRADFGFLGATADEVGTAEATALAGFTRIEVDPWL